MKYLLLSFLVVTKICVAQKTPDQLYGALFTEVQAAGIFPDSKTFVDCTPLQPVSKIMADYKKQRLNKSFSLEQFVAKNFKLQAQPNVTNTEASKDIVTHINSLWKVLQRAQDKKVEGSSLLALPKPYVVPGGRFTEVYYWDSYFTMLGLKEAKEYVVIENMLDNFAHLIQTYGHIPNGNRTYYLSRSQPPFFALMVSLLAEVKGKSVYKKYLPALQKEYEYWMAGLSGIKSQGANKRVVKLDDGTVLNRYCDDLDIPRQEGYKEDVATATKAVNDKMMVIRFASEKAMVDFQKNEPKRVYKELRSAAESGWDFSSRWFVDAQKLSTLRTTEIVPVDLNCLMAVLEKVLMSNGGKVNGAIAKMRLAAMEKYFWSEEKGFYCDYDFVTKNNMNVVTAAGMFPLAVKLVNGSPEWLQEKIKKVSNTLQKTLLQPGGVTCTEVNNGQQWDAPNGWAPLQWMTVNGLDNYGETVLAKDIAQRWMSLNEKVYKATGKLTEKYNVVDLSLETGGGEYPNLDGFGWTNGVYLALKAKYSK